MFCSSHGLIYFYFFCVWVYSTLPECYAAIAPGASYSLGMALDTTSWDPNDPNDDTQDNPEINGRKRIVNYGTIIPLNADLTVEVLSNDDLYGIARQAYDEMIILHNEWTNSCPGEKHRNIDIPKRPSVVAVLAYNHKLYITSSLRGSTLKSIHQFWVTLFRGAREAEKFDQGLTRVYQECVNDLIFDDKDGGHRTGLCAEINIIQQILVNDDILPRDVNHGLYPDPNVRLAAWYGPAETFNAISPCAEPESSRKWACKEWLAFQKITDIYHKTGSRYGSGPGKQLPRYPDLRRLAFKKDDPNDLGPKPGPILAEAVKSELASQPPGSS